MFTDLIREQAFQCAVMMGAGVFTMIMYQLFRNTCRLLRLREAAVSVMEILFWIASAISVLHFLYYCAYGRLSFHAAVSFTAGALLWKKFFYGIIDKIYMKLDIKQGIDNKYGEKETQQPVQRHQSGDRH